MKQPGRPRTSSTPRGAKTEVAAAPAPIRKSAGIKEIATAVGVSIGTVDRALHSRPGISESTRARIVRAAQRLGYRPNLAARHLKLGRERRIAVQLPQEIASYFDALRTGIRQAAERLQPHLEVEFHSFPRIGCDQVEAVQTLLEHSWDGLILAPGSLSRLTPILQSASARGLPIVCVATDAPGTGRLTSISSDPFTSGAVAAELLTRSGRDLGKTAVMTGDLATFDHSEKVRGFRSMLAELDSPLRLVEVAEGHDEYEQTHRQTLELLARHPDLSSIYVSTANSLPVINGLREIGRLRQTTIVVTDLFPELVPLIRDGSVLATLYQRPVTQGRLAFEALHAFIMTGQRPAPLHRLTPYILLRSNIGLFVEKQPLVELEKS